jgi:hypothetical protein
MAAGVKHKPAQHTIGRLGSAFCHVLLDAPPGKAPACVSDDARSTPLAVHWIWNRLVRKGESIGDMIILRP